MTPEQFCYWLQGFVEINGPARTHPTPQEWVVIKDHLALVFKKETPDYTISRPWSPTQPGFTTALTC